MSPSTSPAASLPLDTEDPNVLDNIDGMDVVLSDHGDLIENPDGSADVRLDEGKKEKFPFDANCAEYLDDVDMDTLAGELLKKIDRDQQARKRRDEQYEEGIRRTGLGQDAPGGASFAGASRVVHPMIAEACVDFAAATMKEIYPPNGPAKTRIEGDISQKKLQVARRQERCLNWQLTEQISEYPEELEQLLTQLPLGGSQYMKFWHDATVARISCEFVPIDDILLPYACSDFYSAQRITHVQRLTEMVFEDRVESGFYRKLQSDEPPGQAPDISKAAEASDKVEGRSGTDENVDGERIVYEINTYAELKCDGEERRPYLISIDDSTRKIVAIYRNWEEDDESFTRLEWIVEYGFIAWRGAYKIGLPHLIGGLSAAATGALRAILDAAHFNNLPGFLRLKGARMGGQTKEINPAQGVEIEASAALDDIRKVVMALPYNQPSPVLFELIGWLTEAGKGVVTTAEEKIKDATNSMPVGTSLALIEQGAKVFSSIHARMHRTQKRAFQIIGRLNKKHLSVGEQINKLGEVLATRNDFGEPLAVIPVSDPNIFSETQRYAQMQMVMQLAQGMDPKTGEPTATGKLHNLYEVVKRMYEIAKIPNFEIFLPEPKKPIEMNAAAENSASMMGSPIIAFPEQDHYAHIETHMRFVVDPFLGGSGMAAPQSMPALMEHVKQHLSFLYAKLVYDLVSKAIGAPLDEASKDKRVGAKIDRLIAAASRIVHGKLIAQLQPLGPAITQVLAQIAKMAPPQPMDPAQALLEAEKMKSEQKDKDRQTKEKLEGTKIQTTAQKDQGKLQLDAQGQQIDATLSAAELAHEREKDQAELALKEREIEQRGALDEAQLAQADEHQRMGLEVDLHKDEKSREAQERQQMADHSFQAATKAADIDSQRESQMREHSHKAQTQGADHAHQRRTQESDQNFNALADITGKLYDSASDSVQREHDAKSQERDLKAQDKSQERTIKSTERQGKEKLKHDEKKTKMTLESKEKSEKMRAQAAAKKPKPTKKK